MTERPPSAGPERAQLARPARALVEEVERLSGLPIVIEPKLELSGRARAAYVASDPDDSRHLVLYDPDYRQFLDHMIPHECGHIVRHCTASSNDARLLVQKEDGADRDRLIDQMSDLVDAGMPLGFLRELAPLWLHGSLAQLQNIPADIHIERWLHREFPDLREAQAASIIDQAEAYADALTPDVRDATPPQIWLAGNAMNYAFLKTMGDLIGRPDLCEAFEDTPKVVLLGELLLGELESHDDTGLKGDREITDLWAQRLGMDTWYEWRRLDQLPQRVNRLWDIDRASRKGGRRDE